MAYAGLGETQIINISRLKRTVRLDSFVTASSRHRFLAVFSDDQMAPIGTGMAQELSGSTRESRKSGRSGVRKDSTIRYFRASDQDPTGSLSTFIS